MWGKKFNILKKSPSLDSNILPPKRDQIARETPKEEENFATKWVSCNCDAEECKQQCHSSSKDLETLANEKDVEQPDQVERKSSFVHAVVNMIGMLIGLGQLSTPYALEKGGWTSSFLLVALGMACGYSSHILGKCLQKNPNLRDYKDIGHHAFGSKGKYIVASFIYVEIFMSLVSYTISLHDNLVTMFFGKHLNLPWMSHFSTPQILTTAEVLVALLSLWLRNLSSTSFLSSGGIFMSLIIFSMVACIATFGGVKVNHEIPVLRMRNIPAILGLYVYGFAGHIVFPNLYKAMKDPSKFTTDYHLTFYT